jgi:ABC-type transporter Mla subunit MlaD
MESSSITEGNGEAGIPGSAAGELEALLVATEQAAEALKGQAREQIDASLADLTTLVAELRDAADRLEERLTGIRASVGAEAPTPAEPDALRRARLVALNMAANGASRAETARYLSERLGIRDREALLDSVYESLGGD